MAPFLSCLCGSELELYPPNHLIFSRLLKYSPPAVCDSRPRATIKPPTDQTEEPSMRGADTFAESLFTMRHLDDFVPADHPCE